MIALLALLCACFFAGAAVYIHVAEQPARLRLDDRALLAEWKIAYPRGFAMQAPLAFLGFVLGTWAWLQTSERLFLIGALLMIANWPWTLLVMMRVNKVLRATPPENSGPSIRDQIVKWERLHAVRTILGCLATAAFLMALAR
jgi:Domain of unknown function (DUF1772)